MKTPERWGQRATRDWSLPNEVWLNPDRAEPGNETQSQEIGVKWRRHLC